jgi:nitrous oxidase accessory protein NosD
VVIVGVSNVNMTGLVVSGPGGEAYASHGLGVVLEGSVDDPAVVFNIGGATFNYLLKGVVYGNQVQGVTVSQSNFVGASYGIFIAPGLSGLDQLAVIGSQFNCALAGVYVGSYTSDTLFSSNLFIVPNTGTGMLLEQAYLYSAVGNAFSGSPSFTASHPIGIEVGATVGGGTITGNVFDSMAVAVALEKGSTGANVQSNEYSNDPITVRNLGSGNRVGGGSP